MGAIILIVIALNFMSLKKWLVYGVTLAEQKLGSQTGQLKLKYVYNLSLGNYPILTKLIPFPLFCKMVDKALDDMKDMINNNELISKVLSVGNNDPEVEIVPDTEVPYKVLTTPADLADSESK